MEPFLITILLATDGSADAALAARAAADLAGRTGAALHVVHAWLPAPYSYPGMLTGSYIEANEDAARAVLDGEGRRIAEAGGTVARTHLALGRPADVVDDLGQELAADLVVVGSRGLGPVRRLVLGSVSEGVVHHATRPVLVMRGGEGAWPPARVVVGDDGSADAEQAAALALPIGQLFGAPALLVHASPLLPEGPGPGAEARDEMVRGAAVVLEERAAAWRERTGGGARATMVSGDPASALIAAAEGGAGPALLAVGSRGLGMIARLRLGSVSTKVLHAAHGPVLVVPRRPH